MKPAKDADFETVRQWAMKEPVAITATSDSVRDNLSEVGLLAGYEWIKSNPGSHNKKDFRKHVKQAINQHIEDTKSVGAIEFGIGSIILLAVIQAIIGWIVRKLLDEWIS